MGIDIVFLGILALAAFKGFSRGLIMAVFSFAALFIGLAAALKLSSVVAGYLKQSAALPVQWIPVIAFLLTFLAALWGVRILGNLLQKSVEHIRLGWLNKLGGFLIYAVLYLLLLSVALFYMGQLNLLPATLTSASISYPFVAPWAPLAIDGFGTLIPTFGNLFTELQDFFARVGGKMNI